jgi:peptide/nickel transport system substrate-binding protein
MIIIRFVALFLTVTTFLACTNDSSIEKIDAKTISKEYSGKKLGDKTLIVHALADPDKLNPLCSQGAGATYIEHNVFMYLLDVDKENLEIIPWLAESRPTITEITEGEFKGGLKIDYKIKDAAVWDNGTPVTAYDVAFSLKTTMNPHVDAEHQRTYIDFIKDIKIYGNPKEFSLFTNEKNYAAEFFSGGTIYTIPEYIYDEEKLMRSFSMKQLSNKEELAKILADKNLKNFAKIFNSEHFQREEVVGCGPYTMESWTTSERIKLKKKENWWGEKHQPNKSFENFPDEIIYEIINDQVTAVTAMKDEQIDIMRSIKPAEYVRLMKNERFLDKFNLAKEESLSYSYIGINSKKGALQNKNVRKALAHVVNVPQIIDVVNYGYAQEIASFVHPSKKHYNKKLKPYAFDLEKAVEYLEKAGYTQTDDNGIRFKEIEGEIQKLSFTIKFNSGNDKRENISMFLKENAKKIGINIVPVAREWTVYLDECTNHDFDMFVLGWVQEAIIDDPKQLFHTEAYNGGSNYTGFGDAYSDNLIENLRRELDEPKRIEMLKELQALVHDEVTYIFLYAPDNLMAIHKRFQNAKTYLARPGYDEREMHIAE